MLPMPTISSLSQSRNSSSDSLLNLEGLEDLVQQDPYDALLSYLNDEDIVVNTQGPFFRGRIGTETIFSEGMHVVFSREPTSNNRMLQYLCGKLDTSTTWTLFITNDNNYDNLPPRMMTGDLHNDFMQSHVTQDIGKVFTNDQQFTCKNNHQRSVMCNLENVYVSGVRVMDAFVYMNKNVFVMESCLPFMWMNDDEKPRCHQVKDRKIRPTILVHMHGVNEMENKLFLEITEPGCDYSFENSIVPSIVEISPTTRNVACCNLKGARIQHKPTHSGYSENTFMNICIRDKNNRKELMRVIHCFHLHNSGHTLSAEEKAWRKSEKGAQTSLDDTIESNSKQIQTDHQHSNPPLPRDVYSYKGSGKRKLCSTYVSGTSIRDPPPLHSTQPPQFTLNAMVQPASPPRPHRVESLSPTSPLDLHTLMKTNIIKKEISEKKCCGKCFFDIDDSSINQYQCDKCFIFFHFECTRFSSEKEENIDEDYFYCNDCL